MMKRPAILFALTALLCVCWFVSRFTIQQHVVAIAGMPISSASYVLGPLHVVLHLLVTIVAPILAIAATIDTVLSLRFGPPSERSH